MTEDSPTVAESPYGRSKLTTEWMLQDAAAAHGIKFGILRYFNVAGAGPGWPHWASDAARHPLDGRACEVATGKFPRLTIFGTDYDTPDGTGVRDFIHVSDLVDIHKCVLDRLRGGGDL